MSNPKNNHAMNTLTNSTTKGPTMYETENDIPKSARAELNELINQRVRTDVARETRAIRERIVAQAFAEADFRAPPS